MIPKKNIVLLLSALCFFSNEVEARKKKQSARAARAAQKVCQNAECTLPNCECYCGVKCGPRPITGEDSPRYDEETGQCFCADRDPKFYEINNCAEVDAQTEANEEPTEE